MQRHAGFLTLSFSSLAHTYSHLFTLLYATVVLVLEREWGLSYAELFALSIPMSVLFGAAALPAGWLGDKWSASGMMALFFLGVGGCSILTGFADSPFGIVLGLSGIGLFAAIYHPVGIPGLCAMRSIAAGRSASTACSVRSARPARLWSPVCWPICGAGAPPSSSPAPYAWLPAWPSSGRGR